MKPQRPLVTGLAVAFAMTLPSVLTWLYFVALAGGEENAAQQWTYYAGKTVQFSFPVVFCLFAAPGQLRLSRPRWHGLTYGLAFGLAVVTVMFGLYFGGLRHAPMFTRTASLLHAKLQEFGLDSRAGFVGLAVFLVVPHSLLEEYYWRWFVFGQLRTMLPFGAALALASLGFAAHHVIVLDHYFPGRFLSATAPFSLGVAVGGAVWCWLYEKGGSIWAPWLSHLLIDAGIFAIGWDLLTRSG